MITHLFFDIGSTLVDETECVEARIREVLKQDGAPPREVFEEKIAEFAVNSLQPVKDAALFFGLVAPPWDSSLERVYPDAAEVLEKLSKKYSLGIIANQSLGGEKRLEERGLRRFFDTVTLSAETGYSKPDPAIFRIALESAGCRPENAAMIGDRFDNDIPPAARLGMTTVRVIRGMFAKYYVIKNGSPPDYTIGELCELTKIF